MRIEDVDRLYRRACRDIDELFVSDEVRELCNFIYSLREKNAILQKQIDEATPISQGRDFLTGPR